MRRQDRGSPVGCRRSSTDSCPWPRRCLTLWISILACSAIATPATHAQLLKRPLAIRNARILTMDGPAIENGTLVVKGEKIIALGPGLKAPLLARKVDARGGTVTPGLIDVISALGSGGSARGSASPTRRAEDGFDRYDTAALLDALRNGVTTVYLPARGSAGISGTGAILRLAPGPSPNQSFGRVLGSQAALCIDLGSGSSAVARLKTLAAVRKQFRDARAYRRTLEDYEEKLAEYKKKLQEQSSKKKPAKKEPAKPKGKPAPSKPVSGEKKEETEKKPEASKPADAKKPEETKPKKPPRPARNPKAAMLLRAIDHDVPVRILAHRSEDILNALELAEEFSLDLILEGATEAHLVAGRIADAKVPVVLGNMARSGVRRDDQFRRAAGNNAEILGAAGVRWVVGSGGESAPAARFVALNAQLAAAHSPGLDPLGPVTAAAADTLRIDGQVGRLRPGLLADFVLWSAHPLEPASKVLRVYIGGALVYQAPDETKKGETK